MLLPLPRLVAEGESNIQGEPEWAGPARDVCDTASQSHGEHGELPLSMVVNHYLGEAGVASTLVCVTRHGSICLGIPSLPPCQLEVQG